MTDGPDLLRNMSVPPQSIVAYRGLGAVTPTSARMASAMTGRIVAFRAPEWKRPPTVLAILGMLQTPPAEDLNDALTALIERRASQLPLPDGALVIEHRPAHDCPWPDLLSFLVAVTKSTAHVWLRSKQPSLSRIMSVRSLSIVIPAVCAHRLAEETA